MPPQAICATEAIMFSLFPVVCPDVCPDVLCQYGLVRRAANPLYTCSRWGIIWPRSL